MTYENAIKKCIRILKEKYNITDVDGLYNTSNDNIHTEIGEIFDEIDDWDKDINPFTDIDIEDFYSNIDTELFS